MRTDDRNDRTTATRRGHHWPRRVVLLCLLATGCRGLGKPDTKYDLLTAELRTRERELREAEAELQHLRLLTNTYQRQLQQPPACGVPSYHGGAPALPLREITIGAGTGGVDADQQPGDESLMVVIVPRDDDGSPVKVPARATVTAFEVTREGLKTPIGRWEVPPEQLRRAWKSGLISSGYFVPLQWDKAPTTEKVRVVARLTTLDGREYEADKDVTVRPLPGVAPRVPSVLPPPSVPEMPRGVEELPPPAARMSRAKPLGD